MAIEIGSIVRGAVLKVAEYGAIVRLPEGSTGLVHISEITKAYVRNVRDYINEGDEVEVKVLRLGPRGRFELSIKQCEPDLMAATCRHAAAVVGTSNNNGKQGLKHLDSNPEPHLSATFEDRLSRFLKDSEERMHDLRRHIESKRGKK